MLKSTRNIVFIFLVVVLVLNIYMMRQISNLKTEVNQLKGNNQQHSLEHRINTLQNKLNDIQEAQRWITPVKPELGPRIGDNKQVIKLSWQVKDYQQGESVSFFYRKPGETNFNRIDASHTGGGRFEVELNTEVKLNPFIQVVFNEENSKSSRAIESNIGGESFPEYIYYIAVQNGDQVRSIEEERINPGKLAYHTVSPLKVEIKPLPQGEYEVVLFEENPQEPNFKLSSAFLEAYYDERLISRVELQKSGLQEKSWQAPIYKGVFDKEKINALSLELEYDNGKTIRKELPNILR
ncbi:MAG: hypothetical protein K9L17_03850 [Clostridiales bacterium]|nr:hypothetical protein [Clostridiales bacterium]MCF8021812.1 hypothetical protein [Clostridiales bacterium]